jgi:outer membrane protein assembly factor BamA
MTLNLKNIVALIIIFLLIAACSGTKHLPPGEKLYTGAKIKLESNDKISKRKQRFIRNTAGYALRPEPNKKFLGFRPKLWMYNAAGENPESKFKKWLKKKGEAPILFSSIKPSVTSAIIDARLFNIGIFKSYTESKSVENKHTGKVVYTSHIQKPFTVNELIYDLSDDSISHLVVSDKKKSLIKAGDDYNLENLKDERIRIDALLKNNGYFYFNPGYLLFKADTSIVNHDVTFRLTLKDSIPDKALTVFRINKVFIDQDYSLNEESDLQPKDTIMIQGSYFIGHKTEMKIRPKVILRSVYLKKNEIYSRKKHDMTLNRLMTMGNFKFVRIKFSESDTSSGYLNVLILMTPMPKYTFRGEMELVTKSNNYAGPRLNGSFINRNTFKGAELLNLSLAGSFEAQFTNTKNNLFSYSINPHVELLFPRFLVPFKMKRTQTMYIPRTRLLLSYTFTKRVEYFDMQTFQFIFGYRWRQNIKTEHEINPVNISYTSLANESVKFLELLESNPFLKKSYEEQFIAGGTYSYTYNEQVLPLKKMQYFFQLLTETAGNVFSLANIIGGNKISGEDPSRAFGSVYSQYARLSLDGRGFYNLKNKSKLAGRVYAGLARPYGNSAVLPYTRQFFSGGPNSIRAFSINSVGPGTYNQNNDSIGFLQLGGEVKIEMNAEYRFTIYRFFKGAVFADAGNVWLLKSNPSTIGGAFSFSSMVNDIAVGAGIGIRIDVSFFILRFDLAMPLRIPWLEENNKWVVNGIDFGSPSWRHDNLILNIAIGYPF